MSLYSDVSTENILTIHRVHHRVYAGRTWWPALKSARVAPPRPDKGAQLAQNRTDSSNRVAGLDMRPTASSGVDSLSRGKTPTTTRQSITRLAVSAAVRSLSTRHQIGATPGVEVRFSLFADLPNFWRHTCVG